MDTTRALIIHPHTGADPDEWAELVVWLEEHETVARLEWFDTGRAERARAIGRMPNATRRTLPPRRDVD